jgi:hypothetical protein
MKNYIKTILVLTMSFIAFIGLWSCEDVPVVGPAGPDGPPTVTSIDVLTGEYDDEVTITGTNFHLVSSSNTVVIGGAVATIPSSSTTTIVAKVPWLAEWGIGPVTVTVGSTTVEVTPSFEVTPPTPEVISYEPAFAPEEDTIIIMGKNFSKIPADNDVKFNSVAATVLESDSLSIKAIVPIGAETGSVTVTVNGITGEGPEFAVLEVTIVEIPVTDTAQDAEEAGNEDFAGYVTNSNADLEMGKWDTNDTPDWGRIIVGLAYPDVQVPKGALILNAYLQFEVDEADETPTEMTIFGEDTENASLFPSDQDPTDPASTEPVSFNISSRQKTAAAVVWDIPPWPTVSDRGVDQRTPDLKEIVQAIVDKDGWVSGNSLAFILEPSGANADPQLGDGNEGRVSEAGTGDGPSLVIVYAQ